MLHEDRYGILKSYSTIARVKGSTDRGGKGEEKTAYFYVIIFKGCFKVFKKKHLQTSHYVTHSTQSCIC